MTVALIVLMTLLQQGWSGKHDIITYRARSYYIMVFDRYG